MMYDTMVSIIFQKKEQPEEDASLVSYNKKKTEQTLSAANVTSGCVSTNRGIALWTFTDINKDIEKYLNYVYLFLSMSALW